MVELIEGAKSQLASRGWASFDMRDACPAEMDKIALSLGYSLGEPRASRRGGPLIDHLVPIGRKDAKTRSLSAVYGLNDFPWHTDGAHWNTPPRYLIIGCLEAGQHDACTLICEGRHFDKLNSAAARAAVFRITNGGNSFYTSPRGPFDRFYRYDPGCMAPMNADAEAIFSTTDLERPQLEYPIQWAAGKFLLLDNWRFLHRRGATSECSERRLLRVTVMERNQHG
jgi:hypothetical protein